MDRRKMKESRNFKDLTQSKYLPLSDPIRVMGGFRPQRTEGLMDKWEPLKPGYSWFNRVNLRKKK